MTDQWMKNFPSAIVTRGYSGDKTVAHKFDGEGTKLLYELKNLMKFNDLGQHQMGRIFFSEDGVGAITAKSVFGHDSVHIEALGGTEALGGRPCCRLLSYVSPVIVYTSLQMNGGESQDLEVTDGCPPFQWEVSSGNGTISIPAVGSDDNPIGDNTKITFIAPDENPDCPPAVIRVTDICGTITYISISITIPVFGIAYQIWSWELSDPQPLLTNYMWYDTNCFGGWYVECCNYYNNVPPYKTYTVHIDRYGCDGSAEAPLNSLGNAPVFYSLCGNSIDPPTESDVSRSLSRTTNAGELCLDFDCGYTKAWTYDCDVNPGIPCTDFPCLAPIEKYNMDPTLAYTYPVLFYDHVSVTPPYQPLPPYITEALGYDGQVQDKRTAEMIAQGCCPINPLTGLPF